MVAGLAAVGLALAAIVIPWWAVSLGPFCGGLSLTTEFRLFGFGFASQGSCASNAVVTIISEGNATDYRGAVTVGTVFRATAAFTIGGAVSGAGMLVCAYLGDSRFRLRAWALPLGVLAFVLCLAAPLFVMALLPGAINQDSDGSSLFAGFWGSTPAPGSSVATLTWGPGLGWFLVLAAALLLFVASIALFREFGRPAAPASLPNGLPKDAFK